MKNISKWLSGRGGSKGFVMVGTSVSVFFLIGALLAGAQSRGGIIDLLSGRFWLTNNQTGSVMLANGSSAKVDLRMTIKGAQGDSLEVLRVGNQSLLLDRKSGDVSRLDVANLTVANSQSVSNAQNISLLSVGDKLVVVDPKGSVAVEDPATLKTLSTVQLGQRLTRGVVTPNGTVWVGEPSAGVVIPLTTSTDGQLHSGTPVHVGTDDKMELSLVNDKPTVVAAASKTVITIEGSTPSSAVSFSMSAGDTVAVPPKVIGSLFPISVNREGQLVLVNGATTRPVDLGLKGKELGDPVPFAGRVYVPDYADGRLVVVDSSGNHANVPGVSIPVNVKFSVTVDGGRLWVDDPTGSQAFVLDQGDTAFRQIDKSVPNVPSNDQPPPPDVKPPILPKPIVLIPPTKPSSGSGPFTPVTHVPVTTIPPSAPGAPTNVGAVGGDASAVVSWGPATANGAAIQEYDVSWTVSGTGGMPGQSVVPAGSLQTTVKGLTNGSTYVFTVVAKNMVGVGPGAASPPVTPSSNVPSPPGAATATPNADGSVDLVWPAANGQGHLIQGYDVTATSTGSGGSTLNVASKITGLTAHVTMAAGLVLGTAYAFTVIATNDVNNASTPSQPSNSVTPYTPAAAPGNPKAVQSGANINVTWAEPALNGGTLVSYTVTGDNGLSPQTISSGATATFGGLTAGTSYAFTIAATTSANGKTVTGAKATTPATLYGVAPDVSNLSASVSGDRQISVSFNVDGHNSGAVTCRVILNGSVAWQGGCGNPASPVIGGLAYSTNYDVSGDARNSFGQSASTNHVGVTTNNPPASVTVSHGAPGSSKNGTCPTLASGCHWVHVALRNFPAGAGVRIGCSDSGGEFWTYNVTTDGNGSSDSEQGRCLYGAKGNTLTVTANGVRGSIVW